jgi:hypothetical protein
MKNQQYAQFAHNVYSQFGEDGIIEQLLAKLPSKDGWCVEFGAWDGIHLSNTFNLIKNMAYRSVLIEANAKKFKVLQKNLTPFGAVLVNEFVTFEGDNTLDKILERTPIPKDFDFLSIDIDGNDFWIFDSLLEFRPKLICIEYNPSIPNDVEYIQPRDFSVQKGSSALSIYNLAKQKGYELVVTTPCNLLLVSKEYFDCYHINDNSLNTLRDDADCRVYAFVGYDGTIIHSKPIHFFWHNFITSEYELQVLPKYLRRFASDYNLIQKIFFSIFMLLREPKRTLRHAYTKLR